MPEKHYRPIVDVAFGHIDELEDEGFLQNEEAFKQFLDFLRVSRDIVALDEEALSRFGIKNFPLLKTVLDNCTYERGVRGLTLLVELASYFPLGGPRQHENEITNAVSVLTVLNMI